MPNIVDRYIHVANDMAATLAAPPPGASPPSSGDATVLQLLVPADNTSLEMGAGSTPGIRMETDRHAHISVASPLTTISLGSPGGKGELGSAGLSIITDGDKTELIKGVTLETYERLATVHYKSIVEEVCDNTKIERVMGDRSEDTLGCRYDAVAGDWLQTCTQWKTEKVLGGVTQNYKSLALTVDKDAFASYGADSTVNVAGDKHEYVGGKYSQTLTGQHFLHHIDTKIDLSLAATFTATAGIRLTMNETLDVTHSLAAISNTTFGRSTTTFDFSKKQVKSGRANISLLNAVVAFIVK